MVGRWSAGDSTQVTSRRRSTTVPASEAPVRILGPMPRRREGLLLPLEEAILELGIRRLRDGDPEFHGFAAASELSSDGEHRRLTGHGTLYKVLERLETAGLLESRWETDAEAAQGRPRRRLYQVTDGAAPALHRSRVLQTEKMRIVRTPGVAT